MIRLRNPDRRQTILFLHVHTLYIDVLIGVADLFATVCIPMRQNYMRIA